MMKINLFCTCGATWKGTVPNDYGKFLMTEWDKVHSGGGHNPCDSKTAYKSRSTEYIDFTRKRG